jgi:hypothetical protein
MYLRHGHEVKVTTTMTTTTTTTTTTTMTTTVLVAKLVQALRHDSVRHRLDFTLRALPQAKDETSSTMGQPRRHHTSWLHLVNDAADIVGAPMFHNRKTHGTAG